MTVIGDLEALKDYVEGLVFNTDTDIRFRHRDTDLEGLEGLSEQSFDLDLLNQQALDTKQRRFGCQGLLSLYVDPSGASRLEENKRLVALANFLWGALIAWSGIDILPQDIAYELASEPEDKHLAAIAFDMVSTEEGYQP